MALTTGYIPARSSVAVSSNKVQVIDSPLFADITNGLIGIGTTSPSACLHLKASTTSYASLRVMSGTAPDSPNEGDIWYDGSHLKMQQSSITVNLDGQGISAPSTTTDNELPNYDGEDGSALGRSGIVADSGAITTGAWQGTAVAIAYGGTGATDATTARINLGFEGTSTDNAFVRFDGAIGETQNSQTTEDDSGNVVVAGNLTVNGNIAYLDVSEVATEDPLIKLARNNPADSLDIGYYGLYVNGGSRYAGMFADTSDSHKFKLFTGLESEPTTVVNTAGAGYTAGTLVVGALEVDNLTLDGNTISSTDTDGDVNIVLNGNGSLAFTSNTGTNANPIIYFTVDNSGIRSVSDGMVLVGDSQEMLECVGGEYSRFYSPVVKFGDGSVDGPVITFDDESTTGIYRDGSNTFFFSVSGVIRGGFNGTDNFTLYDGVQLLADDGDASAPGVSFYTSNGTGIYDAGSDVLGLASNGSSVGVLSGANIGLGTGVLGAVTTGTDNLVFGNIAGAALTEATDCVIIGAAAGGALTTGSQNVLMGSLAGDNLTTGSGNIIIGYDIDAEAVDSDSTLNIGGLITGVLSATKSCTIDSTLLVASGAAATCGVNIGVNGDGFYNSGSNTIVYAGAGAGRWQFNQNNFKGTSSGSALLRNIAASGTAPTLIPKSSSTGTGWGAVAADTITPIINSVMFGRIGADNIAIGQAALTSLTTGTNNIVFGNLAGDALTEATDCVVIGDAAGGALTTGIENVLIGSNAGAQLTRGQQNVMIGTGAGSATGLSNVTNLNVFIGYYAGSTTKASSNIAIGDNALRNNDSSASVVAIGSSAMRYNDATGNVAVGFYCGERNASGTGNTYVGYTAGRGTSGQSQSNNTGIGWQALNAVGTSGSNNTALGYNAGLLVSSGAGNILLGYQAGDAITTGGNNIIVGYNLDPWGGATGEAEIQMGNAINQIGTVGEQVADDGSITLRDASFGLVLISVEDGEYALANIEADGTVTMIANSGSNWGTADTDTKYCLYDTGTGAAFKNRIGSAKKAVLHYISGV